MGRINGEQGRSLKSDSGGRSFDVGHVSTTAPGYMEAPDTGHISTVRNMETPPPSIRQTD